jgi:hypothetical protein
VSCVFVEGPIDDRRSSLKDLCKTILAVDYPLTLDKIIEVPNSSMPVSLRQ